MYYINYLPTLPIYYLLTLCPVILSIPGYSTR